VNLKNTQAAVMDYILAAQDDQNTNDLRSLITDQVGIGVDKRMQIYANAYSVRLKEAIETDHEILGLYLGDELFDKMAAEYVASNPSSFHSLRQFCEALPQFLREDNFFSQHIILSDLAGFERALLHAFDAQECPRATFSELQAIDGQSWAGIRFRFHASVQIFRCKSNAVESWQALKEGLTPPAADYSSKRAWLLWRGTNRVSEFVSLAPYQLALLEGFLEGHDFAHQCERMLQWFDTNTAPAEVLSAVQAWFELGIIRSINQSASTN
jgi:hypothetical protein